MSARSYGRFAGLIVGAALGARVLAGDDDRVVRVIRAPGEASHERVAVVRAVQEEPASPSEAPPATAQPAPAIERRPRAAELRRSLQRQSPGHWGFPFFDRRDLDDAYEAGRRHERREQAYVWNEGDMARRADKTLEHHERALRAGVALLREGRYPRAVVALTLATELNHADPASRVHLAQALLAQGHYDDAGRVLRRALQLQDRLIYMNLNLTEYYPSADALETHVAGLTRSVAERPTADACFLLGFMEFQRDRFDAAHAAFVAAQKRGARDLATSAFLRITRPAVTASAGN
ncbi:MAG: hypothetical protein CHACPFDD_02348 [Phycisphaerae bacterium]|nr:hypothetical protein [Phycisphaerae bacterium]